MAAHALVCLVHHRACPRVIPVSGLVHDPFLHQSGPFGTVKLREGVLLLKLHQVGEEQMARDERLRLVHLLLRKVTLLVDWRGAWAIINLHIAIFVDFYHAAVVAQFVLVEVQPIRSIADIVFREFGGWG